VALLPDRPWPTVSAGSPATPTRVVLPVPSDLEIVAGLHQGAEWAAEALYDRVHTAITRTLQRLLRFDRGELDDLVQASFERILRFLSERSLERACNLPAWSSAVAANVALDHLRRRTRERRLFDTDCDHLEPRSHQENPERTTELRASAQRLQGLLGRMKPHYAETLVLHDVLGHDLAEIAALTGASVAAAQSRLVRGRKELLRRAKEKP
jgi:RNA polymerase sigma-70 factor, ECF subfamily